MKSLPAKLKRLAQVYVDTRDPAVFEQIIDASRPVVFYALHTLKKYRNHLRVYEDVDLYDTAIVGIHGFLSEFDSCWSNDAIVPKLISAIMAEVNIGFRDRTKLHYVSGIIIDKTTCSDAQEKVNNSIEIRDQFSASIRKGYVTESDFNLFVDYVVQGETHHQLADREGVSIATMRRKLKHIAYTLRSAWFIEGWEEE